MGPRPTVKLWGNPHFRLPGRVSNVAGMKRCVGIVVASFSLLAATAGPSQSAGPPRPLIEPGRSIAGIRLGETLAELRRTTRSNGGLSISDDGDLVDSDHRWEWHVEAGTPYLDDHGDRLHEDVYVSTSAGTARSTPAHRLVVTHARPPATARVTRIQTVSNREVTADGLGEGSRLPELRHALPHGHLLVFGGPIAWLVDGPGRHRGAFMLYRGVVQSVQIGCPQTDPEERGAPVDPAALC